MKIFLDDFGIFLGRKRNRFVIKKKGEKREVLADDVDQIICTCQGVSFSVSAIRLAVEHGIQIVFAGYGGWPYAILMPMTITGSVKARREQFMAYNDRRGVILAKKFVSGKLKNQANLLKLIAKNRRQTDPSLAGRIYEAGRRIDEIVEQVENLEGEKIDEMRLSLMNLEAEGARIYWASLQSVLPSKLEFKGRVTRGAVDPFNCMLNFGYQVTLFPEVWKAVCYAGLDPYAGFLHADRPGKPSLVLDLMEEFRQQVVDRTLITLVTRRVIKPGGVLAEEGEDRLLRKDVTEKILLNLQERLDTRVMFNGRRGPLKSFIYSQARRIVKFLLGESNYTPFILGW